MSTPLLPPLTNTIPLVDIKTGAPTIYFQQYLQQLEAGVNIVANDGVVSAVGFVPCYDIGDPAVPYITPNANRVCQLKDLDNLLLQNDQGSISLSCDSGSGNFVINNAANTGGAFIGYFSAAGRMKMDQWGVQTGFEFTADPYVNTNKIYHFGNLSFGSGLSYNAGTGVLTATGGGGGGFWWHGLSVPTAAQFTLVSGDATNGTMTDDADVGLMFDGNTPVASNKIRAAEKALANPNADWTYTAHLSIFLPDTSFGSIGIYCRDSVSGRLMMLGFGQNKVIQVNRATLAAFTSTPIGPGWGAHPPQWLRIKWLNASSTFEFWISVDGKLWVKLGTELLATFMVNKATNVGFGVSYNRTTGPNGALSCDYLLVA